MPYQAPGARHTVPAATKACVHGQIVTEDGFVGAAFKSEQVDRWTRPGTAAGQAQHIPVGQEFELMLGGILEAPASGDLADAVVGTDVYITIADNVLTDAAVALTTGTIEAGYRKVGKVTEIDVSRTPDVLRINANGEAVAQVAG